jgi:hypothetical protein
MANVKPKSQSRFPQEVFVAINEKFNEKIYICDSELDGMDDGQVAVYKLLGVHKKATKSFLL